MAKVTIAFAEGGNSEGFVKDGFGKAERVGRWAVGQASVLEIPGLNANGSARMRMRFGPYLAPPTVTTQQLKVIVQERVVYENEFYDTADLTIDLPENSIGADGTLNIRLAHPNAVSPAALGVSDDVRPLAFSFWDISIDDEADGGETRFEVLPVAVQAPVEVSTLKIAAVTMVYNESEYLPIWLSYYGKQVGLENCFIVDHGSDDGSTDFVGPASRIRIPRSPYEPHKQSFFNSKFCNSLLEWYDWVIYSDVDEILVVDPIIAKNIPEYCRLPIPPVVTAIGLNVVHRVDHEPPLDLTRPIAAQRPYVFSGASMCKPLLTSRQISWSPGSHSSDAPLIFDHLYLFHLRWYDFGSCMRRLQKTRSMPWARTDAGVHQRLDDDAMARQFAAFARLPSLDRVDFSPRTPPISPFLEDVRASQKGREGDVYKIDLSIWGRNLWRMPDRFMVF